MFLPSVYYYRQNITPTVTDYVTMSTNITTKNDEITYAKNRLETNSTGRTDYIAYYLTSKPFHDVIIRLNSGAPFEGKLMPNNVTFHSGPLMTDIFALTNADFEISSEISSESWAQTSLIEVIGLNYSGKTTVYDIVQSIVTNDTEYSALDKSLELLTVVNSYPSGDSAVLIVQDGFTDFNDFLNSNDGQV